MAGKRKSNKIVLDHGRWIEVDVSTPLNPTAVMKINKADWKILQAMKIGRISTICNTQNTPYARCYCKGKSYLIHRILRSKTKEIDHKNHNGLDNRRSNLRTCTVNENQRNRILQKNNTSGHKGVFKCKKSKDDRWIAHIQHNKKRIYLGTFLTLSDAIDRRKKAEVKYFGQFAFK